ncbi:V/A-type H+-transporting ATPase subunit D [Peptoniphilus olsenii]|uniref:V-type ATP synthase subunit D n=1 Tax=Peptoniphilus olsenii TaxID=411570 RepID=A0ABV2J8Y5_9FIRM
MAKKVIPTKANLIASKNALELAEKGYDLLDKKRTVLIKEMMDLNKNAKNLQDEIEDKFQESYKSLVEATISMGAISVREISESKAKEEDYKILSRSVMGLELPEIKYKERKPIVDYSLHKSNSDFDRANINMEEILPLIYKLAEIETSVFRLANEIKKTSKRANALDKIQIPKHKRIIREIDDILAEKEREDFFRLKKVKSKKKKKEEQV